MSDDHGHDDHGTDEPGQQPRSLAALAYSGLVVVGLAAVTLAGVTGADAAPRARGAQAADPCERQWHAARIPAGPRRASWRASCSRKPYCRQGPSGASSRDAAQGAARSRRRISVLPQDRHLQGVLGSPASLRTHYSYVNKHHPAGWVWEGSGSSYRLVHGKKHYFDRQVTYSPRRLPAGGRPDRFAALCVAAPRPLMDPGRPHGHLVSAPVSGRSS